MKHPDNGGCTLPDPLKTDILLACAPCQPYAQSRRGTGIADPKLHKSFGSLSGDDNSIIAHTKHILPHVLITENVLGMAAKYKDQETSPKDELIEKVMDIHRPDGSQHFVASGCAKLDSSMWLPGSRPRLIPVSYAISGDIGGGCADHVGNSVIGDVGRRAASMVAVGMGRG